jgi:hypothetical protein
MAVFNEVSFGLALHGRPAGLLMKQQSSELQAEKRGNFVVVGCIEGSKVVSWSLNVSIVLYSAKRNSDRIHFPGSKYI